MRYCGAIQANTLRVRKDWSGFPVGLMGNTDPSVTLRFDRDDKVLRVRRKRCADDWSRPEAALDCSARLVLGMHPGKAAMTAADFRRICLTMDGAEEGSHMGAADFRVGGRIFATLASIAEGYGNLMLDVEHQQEFVREAPEIFLAIPGGWGKSGGTHIRLAQASEDVLTGAIYTAWKLRDQKNRKPARSSKKS